MSGFAGHHLLVPVFSRLMPRRLRVLALLAIAPLLVGVSALARPAGAEVPTTVGAAPIQAAPSQDAPTLVSLPALHAVHAYRLAFEAHSRQAPVDAAPPAHDSIDPLGASSRHALAISAFAQPCQGCVARGYDATAPPALS